MKHECQCQEHDCATLVACHMPGRCGRPGAAREHLCLACIDGSCRAEGAFEDAVLIDMEGMWAEA